MASRAQQQLIILNKIGNLKDNDLCAEIENVIHIRSEVIWSENVGRGKYLLDIYVWIKLVKAKS